MRVLISLILLTSITLAACQKKSGPTRSTLPGSTGFQDKNGNAYVSNGDTRVQEELQRLEKVHVLPGPEAEPAANGADAQVPVKVKTLLRDKLKEFEISRFNAGNKKPIRFGENSVALKVVFINKASVTFEGKIEGRKPNFAVNLKWKRYTLTGTLDDLEDETKGRFVMTDTKTKQEAVILYWAYKTEFKIRTDRSKKSTLVSKIREQLNSDNAFSWVNIWNVPAGHSFFLVDFLPKRGKTLPDERANFFSMSGESKESSEDDNFANTTAKNTKVQVMGIAEKKTGMMFQFNVKEKNQEEEFMLDILPRKTQTKPEETYQPEEPEAIVDEPVVQPAPSPTLPPQPAQPAPGQQTSAPPEAPPTTAPPKKPAFDPQEAIKIGKSYLRIDTSGKRTAKMVRDFNGNRNLDGVKKWILEYSGETGWRRDLQAFYDNAILFRRVLEAVGKAFDVSPAFAYLTVIESNYFKGGKWALEWGKGTTAFGPFQLTEAAATEGKMALSERRYVVPASCGAAKFFRNRVDQFEDSDTTMSILAYNQGGGGAAAAVYCSFAKGVGSRKACAKRINVDFSRADYGRFMKFAKNYDYTYAELAEVSAIPKPMQNYVNQKLAIYFISNDFAKFGFTLPSGKFKRPNNNTIVPDGRMRDAECERVTRTLADQI